MPSRHLDSPKAKAPVKPEWLDGLAGEVWDELAPVLTRAGFYEELYGVALAVLCVLVAEVRRAHGGPKEMEQAVESGLFAEILHLLEAFYMTPASRARRAAEGIRLQARAGARSEPRRRLSEPADWPVRESDGTAFASCNAARRSCGECPSV